MNEQRCRWTLVAGAAVLIASCSVGESATERPQAGAVDVQLCDGETTVTVQQPQGREEGQKVADTLLAQWRRKHPDARWEETIMERHMIVEPADNSHLLAPEDAQGDAQVYADFTERDLLVWKRETMKLVLEGARVFHSADELGSTIAVSCDMCHPDASNTHPETYPKYQTQLGRVALLRDMINWCVMHPVRGERLDPDGPRMRALEAYIIAQRRGEPMNYGRH